MRIHVIRAPTLQAAMRQALQDYGDDAVILDTDEKPDGAVVRVGVETLDTYVPLDIKRDASSERVAAPIAASGTERKQTQPQSCATPKALSAKRLNGLDPLDAIAEALAWHGAPPLVTRTLLLTVEASNAPSAEVALTEALDRLYRFSRPEALQGPVALVGPPGAGKTATVIKLAAMRAMAGVDVCIYNADPHTTGARERLGAFAAALEINPVEVETNAALSAAIDASPHDSFSLVDTTGRAPADIDDMESAAAEIEAVGRAALVLPAVMAPMEAAELAQVFGAAGAGYLVVTGLDMARRIGALLAAADSGNLEIIGVGVGRRIGDGLKRVTAQSLARLILAPPTPIVAIWPKAAAPAKGYAAPTNAPNPTPANGAAA